MISVRPEDVELSEQAPAKGDPYNLCVGTVDQKVFLGEYVDFQIKVGETVILSRAHSSIRTPIGDRIHLRINPEKCASIADGLTSESRVGCDARQDLRRALWISKLLEQKWQR